ncbi:hypothetical protein IL992_03235 [Microbispora sp. NEAU-D428]|uniref:hypothetical protein n=1 Tax=Microbispora sitophila TaxID=2771537 RepID=UPI001865C0DD|nr:hypothetical protein [Microbispora sitophila]MBE3008203.1 hypothetical protein [Microbispora sitophila]
MSLWLSWLVIFMAWGWAIVWSTKTAFAYLAGRAYSRCVVTTVVMLTVWVGVRMTDWNALYVNGMFWLHRDTFAALANAYESGRPMTVPSWMEHLSVNGKVERQGNALYLPVFTDQWRGETGAGIAYLPNGSQRVVETAAGDVGYPVRDLGNGWWWVE